MPDSTVSLTLPELGNPLLEKTVVGLMGFSENFQLGLFQLIGTPPKSQSHLSQQTQVEAYPSLPSSQFSASVWNGELLQKELKYADSPLARSHPAFG